MQLRGYTGFCAIAGLTVSCLAVPVARGEQDPVFRSRATLVPVVVRVTDNSGSPVPDLKAEDFAVTEDGVVQDISYFAVEDYSAKQSAVTRLAGGTGSQERVFVIVLCRGRLQGPSRGFDALIEFVSTNAWPRDRFAVVAFDRITEVTADRQSIVNFLHAYRRSHERIESLFDHWFRGLTNFYGAGELPPTLERLIDTFFAAEDLPPTRQLAINDLPGVRSQSEGPFPSSQIENARAFVYNAAARQDLERLRAAIAYLRVLPGEKHLIAVTPGGMEGLTKYHSDRLAALAADAQIAVSFIHTGGLAVSWAQNGQAIELNGPSWLSRWAVAASKDIAQHTGGLTSVYEYAAPALARIERQSRLQYVIGYVPKVSEASGKYRRIKVAVKRPGVSISHRGGYYDSSTQPMMLESERVATRVTAAQQYRHTIDDIPIEVTASVSDAGRGITSVIRVRPRALSFSSEDGRFVASVHLALFVGDGATQIAEHRQHIDLRLTPDNFAAIQQNGLQFTIIVPVPKGHPSVVKAVVYDSSADRLGSKVAIVAR